MTIHMDKVYNGMVEAYSEQIESTLLEGRDVFKISFDDFRLKMKGQKIIGNKQTAKEKWENMILDEVAYPLGTKGTLAVLDVKALLRVTGFYDEKNKNKNIFAKAKVEVKA